METELCANIVVVVADNDTTLRVGPAGGVLRPGNGPVWMNPNCVPLRSTARPGGSKTRQYHAQVHSAGIPKLRKKRPLPCIPYNTRGNYTFRRSNGTFVRACPYYRRGRVVRGEIDSLLGKYFLKSRTSPQ